MPSVQVIALIAISGIFYPITALAGWLQGIALAALFNPTLRAVKEQLYQSERPWVVDSSKFERAFGHALAGCYFRDHRLAPGASQDAARDVDAVAVHRAPMVTTNLHPADRPFALTDRPPILLL